MKFGRQRRPRPRVLVVNNPSPETSDADQPAPFLGPPPLAVDLSPMSRPYSSPRSNQSNPALSSPSHSSTSSRTFESTPPPSTPGQSNHSEDMSNEGTLRPEHNLGPWTDDSDLTPPSATFHPVYGSVNRPRPMPRPAHRRRPSTDSRPVPVRFNKSTNLLHPPIMSHRSRLRSQNHKRALSAVVKLAPRRKWRC